MAESVGYLSDIMSKLEDLEQAEALSREALGIWLDTVGPKHPWVHQTRNSLAMIVMARGELAIPTSPAPRRTSATSITAWDSPTGPSSCTERARNDPTSRCVLHRPVAAAPPAAGESMEPSEGSCGTSGPITGLVVEHQPPDGTLVWWDPLIPQEGSQAVYDVVTLLLSELQGSATFDTSECMAQGLTVPAIESMQDPPPSGDGHLYLTRGRTSCDDGSFDSGSPVQVGPRDASIDAATATCMPCAHTKCELGAVLDATCDPCVEQICNVEPSCCDSLWGSQCTTEVRLTCGSLICPESQGTCSHTPCEVGAPLENGCDALRADCVSAICFYDPYCCFTAWDPFCVEEVRTFCGLNCD